MDRAAIYCRVSSEEQAKPGHVSLAVQRLRCAEYAERNEWALVAEFSEAESAFDGGQRPEFDRLLSQAEAGAFQHVVVFRADRFSRNAADAFPVLKRLERKRVQLHSTQEDLSNWLFSSLSFVIAEAESRRIGDRVRPAFEHKVKQGKWPRGLNAYSVRRKEDGTVYFDLVEGEVIKGLFQLVADGASIVKAHAWLQEQGCPYTQSGTVELLHNPIFAARLRWKGKEYPGDFAPLVDPSLFDLVQERMRARYRHGLPARSDYAIAGLARCGVCGTRLWLDRHSTKQGKTYAYFRCHGAGMWGQAAGCAGVAVNAERLETWVRRQLATFTGADAAEALVERSRAAAHHEAQGGVQLRRAMERRERVLRRDLNKLVDLALSGTLSRETIAERESELRLALRSVEQELAASPPPQEFDPLALRTALEAIGRLAECGAPDELRELLSLVVDGVYCTGKRQPDWELRFRAP